MTFCTPIQDWCFTLHNFTICCLLGSVIQLQGVCIPVVLQGSSLLVSIGVCIPVVLQGSSLLVSIGVCIPVVLQGSSFLLLVCISICISVTVMCYTWLMFVFQSL